MAQLSQSIPHYSSVNQNKQTFFYRQKQLRLGGKGGQQEKGGIQGLVPVRTRPTLPPHQKTGET